MIIFFEKGQLGNQILQYTALKEIYPNDRLVLFGFKDLEKTFKNIDATILRKEKLPVLIFKIFKKLIPILSWMRVIGKIPANPNSAFFSKPQYKGLISKVFWVANEHPFIHYSLKNKFFSNIEFADEHRQSASNWLNKQNISSENQNLIFVHIRRGDYLNWPTPEHPAVLNKDWYSKSMNYLKSNIEKPVFIFTTDDYHYVNDCFGDQDNVFISRNNQFVDMVLMSFCSHGILSASTFSYCGAYFSEYNHVDKGFYLAPKYFVGHRLKKWDPDKLFSKWITFIE
jgi:hypothetical protein